MPWIGVFLYGMADFPYIIYMYARTLVYIGVTGIGLNRK